MKISWKQGTLSLAIPKNAFSSTQNWFEKWGLHTMLFLISGLSIWLFWFFLQNELGLAYNDARSHLDIGRRVVEGLKPGLAQIGSVWLPLPHLLMIPTVWNDFFWHSGLSGAIQSMASFVFTCYLIYKILEKLNVGVLGRVFGMLVFILNLNILYLQSTAMTELLLIAAMTAGVYELINYHQTSSLNSLIRTSFWMMLATMIRYDGWFLLFVSTLMVVFHAWRTKGWKAAEGTFFLYCTLAGLGIFLWVVWNFAIFGDPLYFAFGEYSAHAQQSQLDEAGVLLTKGNWLNASVTYWYALIYNSGTFSVLLAGVGAALLIANQKLSVATRIASTALLAPLLFNILALYLGHSVLFIQGINGDTWFNVRYGIMMMPSIAVFMGYLFHSWTRFRWPMVAIFFMVAFFSFHSGDAVTIDDGRVGSSQKNVSAVSGWLSDAAADTPGFVLISAASHDAIIFSTGMPMKKFIHEGTGTYWEAATEMPDQWARWIVMRTHDDNDQTYRLVKESGMIETKYTLIQSFPFADIYELKPEFVPYVNTEPILPKQR